MKPPEAAIFSAVFFVFQVACIYQLSFANGIATDGLSN